MYHEDDDLEAQAISSADTAALASAITAALMDSFDNLSALHNAWQDEASGFVSFHTTIADVTVMLEEAYNLLPNDEIGLVWLYDVGHNVGAAIGECIKGGDCEFEQIAEATSRALSAVLCTEENLPLREQIDKAIEEAQLPDLTWNI